jgi:environmental stress-induced protein Ves
MPWQNGGGVTREIARSPHPDDSADFDWRVSIAEVANGGPFSTFLGIDRVLVRIGASPMTLEIGGVEHVLERFEPCAFPGDTDTSASLPGGPTSDLNVMTRRGRVTATVTVPRLRGEEFPAGGNDGRMMVVALAGSPVVFADNGEITLETHDAVLHDGGGVTLDGHGIAAVIELVLV